MCKITAEFDECYNQAMDENGEDFDRAVQIFLEKHPQMDECELMQRLAEEEDAVSEYYAKLAEKCLIQELFKERATKIDE